jgi:integrase
MVTCSYAAVFPVEARNADASLSPGGNSMSIHKRTWKNAEGLEQTAWVVDYVDQAGKRRLKTFERKKDADGFHPPPKSKSKPGFTRPSARASLLLMRANDGSLRA